MTPLLYVSPLIHQKVPTVWMLKIQRKQLRTMSDNALQPPDSYIIYSMAIQQCPQRLGHELHQSHRPGQHAFIYANPQTSLQVFNEYEASNSGARTNSCETKFSSVNGCTPPTDCLSEISFLELSIGLPSHIPKYWFAQKRNSEINTRLHKLGCSTRCGTVSVHTGDGTVNSQNFTAAGIATFYSTRTGCSRSYTTNNPTINHSGPTRGLLSNCIPSSQPPI